MRTCACAYVRACVRGCVRACVRARMRACLAAWLCSCLQVCEPFTHVHAQHKSVQDLLDSFGYDSYILGERNALKLNGDCWYPPFETWLQSDVFSILRSAPFNAHFLRWAFSPFVSFDTVQVVLLSGSTTLTGGETSGCGTMGTTGKILVDDDHVIICLACISCIMLTWQFIFLFFSYHATASSQPTSQSQCPSECTEPATTVAGIQVSNSACRLHARGCSLMEVGGCHEDKLRANTNAS